MIKVIAHYKNGNTVTYKYEGAGEYKGQPETAKERAERHMKSEAIESYELIEC